MTDFRQEHRVRNYLSRGEQRRILGLVLALGLVVLLMYEARKPENWRWFARLAGEDQPVPGDAVENLPDNRLEPPPAKEEIPGTFRSPAEHEADKEAEADTTGRYFPGVKPKYFDAVRDDTIFRRDECDAWFHLLQILDKTDKETLQAKSIGRATFAQLFSQSNDYRGKLVTLRGKIRRTQWMPAPGNDYGIEHYYRAWLQPEDNPTTPMVVYCLYLPEGFPAGTDVAEEVTVTGFFYKRWAYQAKDTLRTTPVVLARTVDWRRAPPAAKKVEVNVRFVLTIIGVALAVSVVAILRVLARTRSPRPREPHKPPDFSVLQE